MMPSAKMPFNRLSFGETHLVVFQHAINFNSYDLRESDTILPSAFEAINIPLKTLNLDSTLLCANTWASTLNLAT